MPDSIGFGAPLRILLILTLASAPLVRGEQRSANSPEAFAQAAEAAQPGDEIVIPDGRYADWHVVLACAGTEAKPIVVRAANAHQAVFTGKAGFRISGRHIVLRGLAFEHLELDGNAIKFAKAHNCRATDCRFTHLRGSASVVHFEGPATRNRVDHCQFKHIQGRSVQVRIQKQSLEEGPPFENQVDHNWFQDVPPKGGNGRETIQIGSDQKAYGQIESKTLVEHNVFLRCSGEAEIISNKSSANVFRGNLFKDCQGSLTLRGGQRCVVEANRFEGCEDGVRVLGTGHTLLNNVIIGVKGSGIQLCAGHTLEQGGLNQAAGDCLIANNTIVGARVNGIWVGSVPSEQGRADRPAAAHDNRVMNNIVSGTTGVLLNVDHSPHNEIGHSLLFATGQAQAGTAGEKGIFGDPLFVKADTGDFRVRPDSPAMGAGAALESGGGSADIGAAGKATSPWELPDQN